MLEVVLNCCRVCYDPEIEVKVMSTETTPGNTGFRNYFSKLFCLFTVHTDKVYCLPDWQKNQENNKLKNCKDKSPPSCNSVHNEFCENI